MTNEARPFISFCIATYKRSSRLRAAIESIAGQETFDREDVEILVFDDASPDDTETVVRELQKKLPTLRYVRNEQNVRADKNIYNLFANFRGEYFFGITDDDSLLPGALTELRKIAKERPEAGLIGSSYEIFHEIKKTTQVHDTFAASCDISKDDIGKIVALFRDSHIFSRTCIRRNAVDLAGYERHIGTMYPHMHTVGAAALRGTSLYTVRPLVLHTGGNEVFWNYPDDYMLNGKIQIIKDLSSIDGRFFRPAIQTLVRDMPGMVRNSLKTGGGKTFRFAKEIMAIPELRWNIAVWYNFAITALRHLRQSLKKKK
jgi:glycosyltransferase involved in cell wall biosynthesis